ncbi:MAG: putative periplasmic protein kinase ArgK and related GTPases of G3E family, partial [uncultured Solirubrobacteraceae bacterium]
RGRRHRPRRLGRPRAHPGLRRLDPGAQGGRHGDPGHHRRQQVRSPAHRHDGPRDPRRALARSGGEGLVAGADRQDGGRARRGRPRARREARRASRARRGGRHALRAPSPQPDGRGAGDRHLPPATRARGLPARGPRGQGAARRGRRAPDGPGERRQRHPRARGGRGRRRRAARPAGGGGFL